MARLNKTSGQAQAGGGEVVSLDEPLLDCVAAAALLNVRVSWVRDAARLGHLPCVRVGRHLRFTRVMLEDWLVVQLARPPAAGRAYAAAAATPRANASPFRRSTQPAAGEHDRALHGRALLAIDVLGVAEPDRAEVLCRKVDVAVRAVEWNSHATD
jgi:excisionase family DNA binding protein